MATNAGTSGKSTNFHFEPFDEKSTKWSRWVKRLETALEIFGAEEGKKTKYLLHYMGAAAYDKLCDKALPLKPEDLDYKGICYILERHYNPAPNEILMNYKFHSRKQGAVESVAEFLVALRHMAVGCGFEAFEDKALRNQFVYGLANKGMQGRLLEKDKLTLEEAYKMAVAHEEAEKGIAEINRASNERAEMVDKVNVKPTSSKQKVMRKSPQRVSSNECFRCGSTEHRANECQHKNTVCFYCKKQGHMRRVCLKEKNKTVKLLNEEGSDDIHDEHIDKEGDVFNVWQSTNARDKIMCKLNVNNQIMQFEVDTGAPVTIVSLSDAKKLFANKMKINEPDLELYSYCKTPIDCIGFIWVEVKTTVRTQAKMYLVQTDRKPLLGREWLRLIKLDWSKLLLNKIGSTAVVNEIRESVVKEGKIKQILEKYAEVFSTSAGKIVGKQARLYIKPQAVPKCMKARRVPFPLLQAVEDELDRQVAEGLLIKVDRSDWGTPVVVVRKKDNKVRVCGDYKITINPDLLIDKHPLPTIEELFSTMAGGDKFTKIDLSQAYLQLEVHPEDQHYLTLSTHKGLYQPTRLMFGVASAPSVWQKFMEQLLADIPGVKVFLDDIRITAENDTAHLQRLDEVLHRLKKHNMRVNLNKSTFLQDKIEYCGYRIDKNGIHKMESKGQAIQQMKQPRNKEEVRAFLGLVNYYGRFIRNLSTLAYPLNRLLHKDVKFNFDTKCERAFKEIKEAIQSDVVLAHYDPSRPVTLAVDASPIGVGAVLSHEYSDGTERPIQFASQTLNEVQQRYSQVDKEAYAVVFGVSKFYQYLYGRRFTLITDNKAISQIFSPCKGLPILSATRMQHYAIYLESFEYDIRLRRSKENANADALSRLPAPHKCLAVGVVDQIETEIIENLPVTVRELSAATQNDNEVKQLVESLKYGRDLAPKFSFGIDQNEFTLQQGCLLRGIRVYIPSVLRNKVLQELHTGHFGLSKMKALARAYCWWKNLDKDIEELVANCRECQISRADPSKDGTHCWVAAKRPFERVHVDFAGPFLGKYFLVLVDAYTKWPEVRIIPDITAATTIKYCRSIFCQFGLPSVVVSDHGTQFKSAEFQFFLKQNGIIHKMGAPYHPATNGLAERFVQTFKTKLRVMQGQQSELQRNLDQVLFAYRRAIHPATNKSPAMMMFGRQIYSRLDLMLPSSTPQEIERTPVKREFHVGEKVKVRDYMSKVKWKFGIVLAREGELHYTVKIEDGRIWRRHIDQMQKVGEKLVINTDSNSNQDHRAEQSAYEPSTMWAPVTSYNVNNAPRVSTCESAEIPVVEEPGSSMSKTLQAEGEQSWEVADAAAETEATEVVEEPGTSLVSEQSRCNINEANRQEEEVVTTPRKSTRIKRLPTKLKDFVID